MNQFLFLRPSQRRLVEFVSDLALKTFLKQYRIKNSDENQVLIVFFLIKKISKFFFNFFFSKENELDKSKIKNKNLLDCLLAGKE